MQEHQPSKVKASWISRLAEESWEAELIISGIAIYGSLKAPPLLYSLVDWGLFTFSDDILFFFQYFFLYLFVGVQSLIGCFILHFLMRALWIGLIGLNSVYPEGIVPSPKYSDYFFEKIKTEFPDLNGFIKILDDWCSIIFAIASSAVMMFVSFSIFIMIVVLLGSLIHFFIPPIDTKIATFLLIFIVVAPTMFLGLFNLKAFKDRQWVQRVHFPLYKLSSQLIYTIFYRPINYIIQTFYTQGRSRSYWMFFVSIMAFAVIGGMKSSLESNIRYSYKSYIFNESRRTDRILSSYYDDRRGEDELIVHASIPSDIISGPYLSVFVPVFEREESAIEEVCGDFQEEMEDKEELRNARYEFRLACMQQYHQLYINDSLCTQTIMRKYVHPDTHADGVLAYIPTDNFKPGNNWLKIIKQYRNSEGKLREILIPFMFNPGKI